ncbi:copper transport protein ATX1-like [Raphidocelis subcapitata]|uniref:Copper transport protein ATX1-like n=1 Tax=Raphidocelis subcapitata TaxID=307507 RepID=A0A2V0NZ43_9CHLO|nr:copper transport protein ATX1-like [Raphidocelis subcapitata]|eukprot:GBF92908.1 copper transport protein ATX1-like [Raphidocelis subcapitata]
MTTEVVLNVEMACSGCSGAVERVLKKMAGVQTFDVSLEKQRVVVRGDVTPEAVLETVRKTGKKAELAK